MAHHRPLILMLLIFLTTAAGHRGEEKRRFVLEKPEQLVKSEGGEVRVARGPHMHIGFISMEPNTLFIPQYADADLFLFVRRGDAKLGWIEKDEFVEKRLKTGDVNRVRAGSAFYIVNLDRGQRLLIICSIIPTASDFSWDFSHPPFQSFYLGGGFYPKSVLAGFDTGVLVAAFNSTLDDVRTITQGHAAGPIVYLNDSAAIEPTHIFQTFGLRAAKMKAESDEVDKSSTLNRFLNFIIGRGSELQNKKKSGPVRAPDSYNLYDRDPDYRNRYGWTIALDERDYHPLKHSDIGIYLVNLTAGSMLAPHVNPRAAEYGIVIGGTGVIQVVYPNGTSGMKTEVVEGDVFWIPRYFPFCQVALRGGPLELFGFTTAARANRPQFLAGVNSVLRVMMGDEVAAGFGVSRKELERVVMMQNESVVLPMWPEKEVEE